jgi:hypothetical protein
MALRFSTLDDRLPLPATDDRRLASFGVRLRPRDDTLGGFAASASLASALPAAATGLSIWSPVAGLLSAWVLNSVNSCGPGPNQLLVTGGRRSATTIRGHCTDTTLPTLPPHERE